MAMTYQQFKDYIVTSLWRTGDTTLISNLDNLIRQANAELTRRLSPEVRHASATLSSTALSLALPTDYHAIRSLVGEDRGEFRYVNPAHIKALREHYDNLRWLTVYSLEGDNLLLSGPVSSPIALYLDYKRDIPDYSVTDSSWLEDEFLDVYVYAVCKQAAPFLREDERLSTWIAMLNEGIDSINEDAEFNRIRGVSQSMPLPRQAGISRKRRVH